MKNSVRAEPIKSVFYAANPIEKAQSGFSMIELLVGVLISMMVVLAIAGTAQFLELQKRITVGKNSTLETLAITTNTLEEDIRMAGFGLSSCPVTHLVSSNDTEDLTRAVTITAGADNKSSDTLQLVYGDSQFGISKSFLTAMTDKNFSVNYAGQLTSGSLALISDGTSCDVYFVNANPTPNAAHNSYAVTYGTDADAYGNSWTDSTVRKAGAMVLGFNSIKNLTYSLNGTSLQVNDAVAGTPASLVADNIVMVRFYYGLKDGSFVAANSKNNAGTDYSPAGLKATPSNLKNIKSIRMFIVARSPVLNKPGAKNICTTTTSAPSSWTGGPVIDLSTTANWGCYRYSTSDLIVPLKNVLLSAS
ncbi:PilW family protein [Undibacterium sp. SXout11W]|uniref:PilW family protein n=1 Tax=Undibacterium sp. SXout11W TaxID=3413050 RepID=UPI003BEF9965